MPSRDTLLTPVIVGVDVGGTNTDAVALKKVDQHVEVIAAVKKLTTADVTTGVRNAVFAVLKQAAENGPISVTQVNIGTTHFINAVVQGRGLAKVSVIRLCGTTSRELPPFSDFPLDLKDVVCGSVHLCGGGYRYDGREIDPVDPSEISNEIGKIRDLGVKNIAVSGVFANVKADQEEDVLGMIEESYPEASVTLSHKIGQVGLLERENATILNECLKPLCEKALKELKEALTNIGVSCPIFLTQNDGTIISSADAMQFPVRTFASGPTNSMKGAAFLSNVKDAIIVDIGGTTTDVGVLENHFPRLSSTNVNIGGVRANLKMPSIISITVGGGSYVSVTKRDDKITSINIGPGSAGCNLKSEALCFGSGVRDDSRHLTVTDVAIAAGMLNLGDRRNVEHFQDEVLKRTLAEVSHKLEGAVEKMGEKGMPVVIVGGASFLLNKTKRIANGCDVLIPQFTSVASAIGAALSQETGMADYNIMIQIHDADTEMFCCFDKEEAEVETETQEETSVVKQRTTSTGSIINERNDVIPSKRPREPVVDSKSGEWILSEYDIEALVIGTGIFGCGGGGNPYVGRVRALNAVRKGKKISVISPEMLYTEAYAGKKYVATVAFMGIPVVGHEQLVSSTESTGALKVLSHHNSSDGYTASSLNKDHDIIIQKKDINLISDRKIGFNQVEDIAALMPAEIGGLNALEPLLVSADLGIPVIDSDGMGRAFPELQMFCPYIYGLPLCPVVAVNDKGTTVVVLKAPSAKSLENQLRETVVQMGGAAGITLPRLNKTDVMEHTILYSISRAWRLGDAILRSRHENTSSIAAILEAERSIHVLTGKIQDVTLNTKGGFDRGQIIVGGTDDFSGQTILVEFKNENLVIFSLDENKKPGIEIACVPDLITIVDADTAEPIPTEEVKYGMRVAVLVLAAPDLLKTEQALKYVGPKAFNYDDVTYVPIGDAYAISPIPKVKL